MGRGVIFDVDGTLVDSNRAHAESWAETLTNFGHSVSADDVQPLIGMGGDKLLPRFTGVDIESDRGKEYAEYRTQLFFRKYLPQLRAFPGARELVERLRADDFVIVTATSASEEELEKLLAVVGIKHLLTDTTSADDAENSKPDPDIVHAAVRRTGLRPADSGDDRGHSIRRRSGDQSGRSHNRGAEWRVGRPLARRLDRRLQRRGRVAGRIRIIPNLQGLSRDFHWTSAHGRCIATPSIS